MTGMGGTTPKLNNPVVVAHFNQSLWRQMIVITLLGFAIALIVTYLTKRAATAQGPEPYEPPVRRILRIGFGCLWIIAGLLQLQPEMPIGLPTQVVAPTIASAPGWLQHVVTIGTDAWLRHPIIAATGTVWLQLGLGLWLVAAKDGWWSRVAGWMSAGWALAIWVLGNGLGGLFVPPVSWMFGAPGATIYYVLAGVAIGVPVAWLERRNVASVAARATGVFLLFFALLQAWPGRGFWHGQSHGQTGQLSAMASTMSEANQPGILVSVQHWFSTVTLSASWLVNAIVVLGLGFTGFVFLLKRRRLFGPAVVVYVVLALADWILVQDLAIFGGVGTDVNSMIPSAIVVVAVWRFLVTTDEGAPEPVAIPADAISPTWRARTIASSVFAVMTAIGGVLMVAVGVLPGASAEAAIAAGSTVSPLGGTAPGFTLTNQDGHQVSLSSLRGKTVVLSFIDPVCTGDCPIEAQEMRAASDKLGNARVAFIAVNVNPLYRSVPALVAFNEAEGLTNWPAWNYLTGTPAQLERVWNDYGVAVEVTKGGSMVSHAEPIYIIDPTGRMTATWTVSTGSGSSSVLGESTVALIVAQVKAAA